MQLELFQQPSWTFYNIMHSPRDQVGAYGGLQMDGQFLSILSNEYSSGISLDQFLSTIFSNEFLEDPMSGDESQSTTPVENIADDMEEIDTISGGEFEDVCRWLGKDVSKGSFPSEQLSTKESQLSIQHLLKAYGEGMEMEQRELAEVIVKCIVEKESKKNFEAAFNAFYQIFPYGRFARFTANSAILEAMLGNVETVDKVGIEDLVAEIGKIKKRGVAKELLADSGTNKGLIAIGDGDAAERLKSCTTYEARLAMENLFVAPSISYFSWRQKWEEMREDSDLRAEIGLEGLQLTKQNLTEAKEMVEEGKSFFTVRIEHRNRMRWSWNREELH
ncbi:hypothetical protein Acr_02g0006460 [Actinidia rufa]|uniref:Uncharacterized protein n=1 Tax=Actinidia rufa TaxID=165716 RepID=A0A7J0E8A0_9ERIC|nr:hypothetical protein Acr_02g0006460 [Actinidia rufa]